MDSLQKQHTATVKRNIKQQPLAKWPLPIAIWYPPTSSTSSATTFGDNGSLSGTATTSSNDRWVYQMQCLGLLLPTTSWRRLLCRQSVGGGS
ncbi:GL23280 [Drosophila persimilis]|uniref:GL23280 n=1 Tax=Drosophila persimilis TaxID=7234 RepID=B4G4X8_DROPE|nr:GL23280 [Drosophila persimilis]